MGVTKRAAKAAAAPVSAALLEKIRTKTARVGVMGLGYAGLPLAMAFAEAGFRVTGLDLDPERARAVNEGRSYLRDLPDGRVGAVVRAERLRATGEPGILAELDTVTICVPTPLRKTREPELSYILAAARDVARHLHRGQLVILQSTTYPGTTEELLLPMLAESGLRVGEDFFLAYSPERVDPGNRRFSVVNTPRVVSGVTPVCLELTEALYGQAIETLVPVSSTRTAEFVKLLENTFRQVNIGLANESAIQARKLGIDIWEAIDAAATKPFGFMPFYPGPGLGGECIPVVPHFLAWKLRAQQYPARFIQLADEVNLAMPAYIVTRVAELLNRRRKCLNGARILVLGVTYKRDTADVRESPSLDVIARLREQGAEVTYHDPYIAVLPQLDPPLSSVDLTPERLGAADCVVVLADHQAFDPDLIVAAAPLVFDSRNLIKGREHTHVEHI